MMVEVLRQAGTPESLVRIVRSGASAGRESGRFELIVVWRCQPCLNPFSDTDPLAQERAERSVRPMPLCDRLLWVVWSWAYFGDCSSLVGGRVVPWQKVVGVSLGSCFD